MNSFKELLEQLTPDEWVCVGTVGGSGFLAIETAGDIIKKMARLNIMVRDITRQSLQYSRERKEKLNELIPKVRKQIAILHRRRPESFIKPDDEHGLDYEKVKREEIRKQKELLIEYEHELKRKEENIAWAEEYLKNYVPVAKRTVIEKYKRALCEPIGTIMLLEGEEYGGAWFLSEVKERL